MKRAATLTCAALTLTAVGCVDLGLEGNVPAEESRTAMHSDLVAAVWAPADSVDPPIVVDGRLWVPTGRPLAMSANALRPVGSSAGRTVYARPWDERPYGTLFTAVPRPSAEAARTAREAMDAGQDHWQMYGPVTGRAGPRSTAPTR